MSAMSGELPPILLLSPGRSGSSVLQQALNTSERIVMWGEHSGFLTPLSRSFEILTADPSMHALAYDKPAIRKDTVRGALADIDQPINWANAFEPDDVVRTYRRTILDLFAPGLDRTRVHFGFKEIRYREPSAFIDMWLRLFPDTRFVFIVRDPAATLRSMYLAWRASDHPDETVEGVMEYLHKQAVLWRDLAGSLLTWHGREDTVSKLVHFEELERHPERVMTDLFDWLDLPVPAGVLAPFEKKTAYTRDRPRRALADEIIRAHPANFEEILGEVARSLGYGTRPD